MPIIAKGMPQNVLLAGARAYGNDLFELLFG